MTPNRFQRNILDLVEATQERLLSSSPYCKPIREAFEKDPARTLRDYCTVGLLLPQRSGKTVMSYFLGPTDVVVFANEKERDTHAPAMERLSCQFAVAHYQFRDVKDLDNTHILWIMDPYWNDTGVDKAHYFKLVADTFKRPIVSVFLDSPFTERS